MTATLDTLLERVPVDEITETAQRITPSRTFAAITGGLLFVIGWLVAKAVGLVWYAAKWAFAAALVGWKTARHEPMMQPDIAKVMAENLQLREAVRRLGG